MERQRCTNCDAHLTLEHLVVCRGPIGSSFRDGLQRDLLSAVSASPSADAWRRTHGQRGFRRMLLSLFPFTTSTCAADLHRHLTRLVCGAFTQSQAAIASKLMGFDSIDEDRHTLVRMRLLCLQHLDTLFSGLKKASRS